MEKGSCIMQKVSLVTPVYNGEGHLTKMLDSILSQTYQDVEVILVDDGSTDGTVSLAESYRKQFVEKGYGYRIIKEGHRNASAAINRGLPYVTGEYLIWPDSDDVLEPDSIEKRVTFLQTHPQYQCVRTLAYYFDAESGRQEKADEATGDLLKEELFWDILEAKTFVCCGCYMLKTEAFFEIYPGRRIPEYDVGQNFQMLLPFLYIHKCPTIQEQLYGVCVRKGSHSRRTLTRAEEEKKYQDYEELIKEIAVICGGNSVFKRRIKGWICRRRYQISLKYGCFRRALKAGWDLYRCREVNTLWMLKSVVRIGLMFSAGILKKKEKELYDKRRHSRLKNRDFTIIASNCNGTFMYYDLQLSFLSPTINLMIKMDDFVRMVENLEWYMQQEIVEDEGDDSCPVGLLGDVRIYFIHYATFEEGVQKWMERRERINWDNIFIVGAETDQCSYETIERFDRLPFRNKVILTHVKYPEFESAYYLKGFEGQSELGITTSFKNQFFIRRYLDGFDYVRFLNNGGKKGC